MAGYPLVGIHKTDKFTNISCLNPNANFMFGSWCGMQERHVLGEIIFNPSELEMYSEALMDYVSDLDEVSQGYICHKCIFAAADFIANYQEYLNGHS